MIGHPVQVVVEQRGIKRRVSSSLNQCDIQLLSRGFNILNGYSPLAIVTEVRVVVNMLPHGVFLPTHPSPLGIDRVERQGVLLAALYDVVQEHL